MIRSLVLGSATFLLALLVGLALLRLAHPPTTRLCSVVALATVLESGANGRDRGAPRHGDP